MYPGSNGCAAHFSGQVLTFQSKKCSLLRAFTIILDTANPYRTLEVRARAEIMPDADYAFAKKLGAKYGGADLRTNDRPGETRVVVSLQPIKVNTWG